MSCLGQEKFTEKHWINHKDSGQILMNKGFLVNLEGHIKFSVRHRVVFFHTCLLYDGFGTFV